MKKISGWSMIRLYTILIYIFMFASIVAVIILSFNPEQFGSFPMKGFSFKWYFKLAQNKPILLAFKNSLILGSLTAVLVTAIGIPAAMAFKKRVEQLLNLEVVLGSGEVLKTGFAHYPRSQVSQLFRHGIGPDLTGALVQSNFGVVTAAAVELLPRPEQHVSFLFNLSDPAQLGGLVEELRGAARDGLVRSVVHIANRRRSEITVWKPLGGGGES